MGISSIRIGRALGLVVLAAVGVWACGDDGTEPPVGGEDNPTTVRVVVSEGGDGVAGVTVRLFDVEGASAIATDETGSTGRATFEVDPGAYEAEIDVPAELELDEGETPRKSVTVAEGGTSTVSFALVRPNGGDVVEIRATSALTFEPSEVTISPGTTVRWVNETSMLHTVTPDDHEEWERAQLPDEGDTFTHTFDEAGDFDYFCEPHLSAGMTGSITVQ